MADNSIDVLPPVVSPVSLGTPRGLWPCRRGLRVVTTRGCWLLPLDATGALLVSALAASRAHDPVPGCASSLAAPEVVRFDAKDATCDADDHGVYAVVGANTFVAHDWTDAPRPSSPPPASCVLL